MAVDRQSLFRQSLLLYLVTDRYLCADRGVVETVMAAVRGGTSFVQLRDKDATTQERVSLALQLKQALAGRSVPLVINDDVEAALASDADGVHIGQDDMDVRQVRQLIGPDKILGLSVETEGAARKTDPELVDYAGAGPVFATQTKQDHKQPTGFDGLQVICAALQVPSVAIGGLKTEHCQAALAAGADGVAVVSAVCGQPDPEQAARKMKAALESTRG